MSVKTGHFSHVFHMVFHIHTPSSEVCQKIQERDNKYVIDPTKHMPELEEYSFAPRVVKRKREE